MKGIAMHLLPLAASLLACSMPLATQDKTETYDVDVTLVNPFPKELVNHPVILQVFRIFGRGVDYAKFNRDGFHITDEKGQEVEFFYRSMPPSFSIADDQLILMVPSLAPGARLSYRFTNTAQKSRKEAKLDIEKLLDHPANL